MEPEFASTAGGADVGAPNPTLPAGAAPITPACNADIPSAVQGGPADIVVSLDPSTLWRPRGAEVAFTFSSATGATAPDVRVVEVCFRWSDGSGVARDAAKHGYLASPLVRSVPNTAGAVEYAATVPELARAHVSLWDRFKGTGDVGFTGVYVVPVARMQVVAVVGTGAASRIVAAALPVGITDVPIALLTLAVALLIALVMVGRCAPQALLALAYSEAQMVPIPRWRRPRSDGTAAPAKVATLRAKLMRRALAVISSESGEASLSQFQIMLWSFVVGGAAVYVMTLSGNLIEISTGTLTLLGIAGGASLLGRIPSASESQARALQSEPPPLATPAWCQMLYGGDDQVDVTRIQMLLFTLICAAFVAIKVAVTFSIPEIPDNFLLLMGISNGVYIAGKHIPS